MSHIHLYTGPRPQLYPSAAMCGASHPKQSARFDGQYQVSTQCYIKKGGKLETGNTAVASMLVHPRLLCCTMHTLLVTVRAQQ
jgi:hypothetical protein